MPTLFMSGTFMPISQGRTETGFMSGTFMPVSLGLKCSLHLQAFPPSVPYGGNAFEASGTL